MTEQPKRVLLVDDEEKLLQSIARRMKVLGLVPFMATSGMAAIDIAMKNSIDLAIVDLQMPDMNGLVTITKLKEILPDLRTVLLTGHGDDKVKQATESLNTLYFEKDQMGGFWRFIKQLNADGKVVVIGPSSTSIHSGNGEVKAAGRYRTDSAEVDATGDFSGTGSPGHSLSPGQVRPGGMDRLRIVGETPAMQSLRKNISRIAPLDFTVTLRGEPGTGKELAARIIHAGSARRNRPFLAINCADFRSEQLAHRLLGHGVGTLCEAIRKRSGMFGNEQLGTILFDQVEKLPSQMRHQMLHVLDMTDSWRAGSLAEAGIDIRILVSTEMDLSGDKGAGAMGKDLFERLKVLELAIPPLRNRKDDIAPLCRYFFDRYRREMGKPVESVAGEVVKILVDYDFPGNVRELEYIIERAVILAEGRTIERKHLPNRFLTDPAPAADQDPGNFTTLAEMEKRYILQALEANNGNKSKTAQILGISRAALWRKLKQFRAEG